MSDVPVVWLTEGEPSRDEAARALGDWARARGLVLSVPGPARTGIIVDPTIADAAEGELARAYDALAADDLDAAGRSMARAEALLRDHPELPAAPFLRAEVARAWSRLRLRQGDEAAAATAWQDAAALDGGRVAGIGEKSFPLPPKVPFEVRTTERVTVDGLAPTGEVLPGEHAVVLWAQGVVVQASWVAVRGPLRLVLPPVTDACSLAVFSNVKREGDHVTAAATTCPSWVAAVPTEQGVLVATCDQGGCTSLTLWRGPDRRRDVFRPLPPDRARAALPAWATWTALGIGAATLASVVLIASGVFESRPVEPRFVMGGARQE